MGAAAEQWERLFSAPEPGQHIVQLYAQQGFLARGVARFPERLDEAFAVGVFADEPVADAVDTVHGAHQLGGGAQSLGPQ